MLDRYPGRRTNLAIPALPRETVGQTDQSDRKEADDSAIMTTSDENPLHDTDLEARPSAAVPKILWVIPIAALLIVAAVVFRQLNGPLWIKAGGVGLVTRRAPAIVLQDQNSEFVRTVRYLDRQKLIVVFYNGELGPEQSQQLLLLRDGFSQIEAAGAEIVAVSSASPYRNREGAQRQVGSLFPC